MERPVPSSYTAQRTMEANRRTDTGPEVALRAALHARGLRFRKDYPVPIPGRRATRVDVAFTRARLAVFMDGCFWHGCPDHGMTPKANAEYWAPKLAHNRERDHFVTDSLVRDGWMVMRVWEHEDVHDAAERIAEALGAGRYASS